MLDSSMVSVLMNCYNGEQYLAEAIESVLNQTHKNLELVFWDNQSTDRSASIIQSYDDDRIRYINSSSHTNLSQARKLAYPYLKGDWVAILDVDDVWDEQKLEKQLACAQLIDNVGFIYCKALPVNAQGQKIGKHVFLKYQNALPKGQIYKILARGNYISIASLLISKSKLDKIGGFSGEYPIMEDYYVTLNLSKKYPVSAVDEILCQYRIHGENESLKNTQDNFEDLQIVKDLFPDRTAYVAALRIMLRHIKTSVARRKTPNIRKIVQTLCH